MKMKTYKEYINEGKIIMSDVEKFIVDSGTTNMEFKLEDKIIKFGGTMSRTGQNFDTFYDMMKDKYGRKFNFIEWKGNIATFEIKI
jgi:hypothetical protein